MSRDDSMRSTKRCFRGKVGTKRLFSKGKAGEGTCSSLKIFGSILVSFTTTTEKVLCCRCDGKKV